MQTIRELLNKIRWDKKENPKEYTIGYLDRVKNRIIKLPLDELEELKTADFSFTIYDEQGHSHQIPFHRIKRVWKKNVLVRERKGLFLE